MSFSLQTRREQLASLPDRTLDLIVIGGGVVGAGIAWEAALRGLSVAVLEKNDFASGTSSKSSKLLHGGLRYLEQLEVGLVFESLSQRNRLFDDAPHLASRLKFMFPIYKGGKDKGPVVNLGLWLYDVLANVSQRRHATWHRRLPRAEALQAEPKLHSEGLQSAYVYQDGVTEDARLVIETVKSAVRVGALALSQMEVTGFAKDAQGKVQGVEARDGLSGETYTLRARRVFNAAGPWVDALLRLDDPQAHARLRPTKGVHILVESIVHDHAVVMRSHMPGEKAPRVMFVIPWGGRTLIGTTDTDHCGDADDFSYLDTDTHASPEEVQYLLAAVNATFDVNLMEADVISSYAGWRPLMAPPAAGLSASSVSREHEVFETPSGLLGIAGGKLTAYRTMARQAVDEVLALLGPAALQAAGPSQVETARICGSEFGTLTLAQHVEQACLACPELPVALVSNLACRYGSNWPELLALLRQRPDLAQPLEGLGGRPEGPDRFCVEPVYAALHEGAVSVADFLMRRTRLQLLDADQAIGAALGVGTLMASAHQRAAGWSDAQAAAWAEAQANSYKAEVEARRKARGASDTDAEGRRSAAG